MGCLQDSPLRSVAWKLFLRVLPAERDAWQAALAASRERYALCIKELLVDPHNMPDLDLAKNNPLSQDDDVRCNRGTGEGSDPASPQRSHGPGCWMAGCWMVVQSPWQQYFADQEFRKDIEQDVLRTYPEIDFFQLPHVQQDMLNILFCFARRNPALSYRQVSRPATLCTGLPPRFCLCTTEQHGLWLTAGHARVTGTTALCCVQGEPDAHAR
jgi:TBC1 domain family member 5